MTPKPLSIGLHCWIFNQQFKLVLLNIHDTSTMQNPDELHWLPIIHSINQIAQTNTYLNIHRAPDGDVAPCIHVILVDSHHLGPKGQFLDFLPNSPLRSIVSKGASRHLVAHRFNPIITISYKDLATPNAHEICEEQTFADYQPLDPRVRFLDASIWHRYVPEFPAAMFKENFASCFSTTLDDVVNYWQDGLYYTVSALSTLEFQLRILQQSYIGKFGDYGHDTVVIPFKFHSERYLKHLSELEMAADAFLMHRGEKNSLLKSIKWQCLVVDDNADSTLSTIGDEFPCNVSKKQCLEKPLTFLQEKADIQADTFDLQLPNGKRNIIQQCLQAMEHKVFDLIFLDYLLGEGDMKSTSREFGHQFLQDLLEDSKELPKYKSDFLGKYWIFPISSFPYALNDHLLQVGLSPHHHIWNLSNGSDPLSTPYHYAYYLLRFIKQKIRTVFLDDRALLQTLRKIPFKPNKDACKPWAKYLHSTLQRYENLFSIIRVNGEQEDIQFSKSILKFTENETKMIEVISHFRSIVNTVMETSGINLDQVNQAEKKLQLIDFESYRPSINYFLSTVKQLPEGIDLSKLTSAKAAVFFTEADRNYFIKFKQHASLLFRDNSIDLLHGIMPGDTVEQTLEKTYEEAHLLIFLISVDMTSDFLVNDFWERSIKSSPSISKKVFPIKIRHVSLNALSSSIDIARNSSPVGNPENDLAWDDICDLLKKVLTKDFPSLVKWQVL
jgi:hypothetical protein